jgi:glycosyltransferase involved in cell wall biosynthesis
MKILLLSFEYPPETGFGGIGTYTWYHAHALGRLGHEVHVLAGATQPTPLYSTRQDGVHVHRFRATGLVMAIARLFGLRRLYWTKQRIENAWCMLLGLRQLQKQHRFDVIEMPECGAEGALINQLTSTPTVVRFHSPSQLIMPFYDVPALDIVLCSWIEQLAIRHASALTSCSSFLAHEAREKLAVHRHIEVIANGIDLPLFDRQPLADISHLYMIPPGHVTILFAGRMEPRKGIHLCTAIAEIVLRRHDVTFLFAGEDIFGYVEKTMLPTLAGKQLLGSVRYLGKLTLDQLRACARAVDIYLLPSLWENCPYACLEAMASARAVVCARQGGMPELIQHGIDGLLATAESPQSFARQLELLIEDAHLRRRLGAAARQTVERNFTDLQIATRTLDVYRRAASSGS